MLHIRGWVPELSIRDTRSQSLTTSKGHCYMSEIGFQNCLSETLDSNLWRFQRVNATCRESGSRIVYRKLQNPTFDEFKRFHSTSQRLTSKIVYQKLWILATDNFKEIQYQEQQLLLANLRIPTIGLCEQCSVRWEILFWSLWHCTLSANRVSTAPRRLASLPTQKRNRYPFKCTEVLALTDRLIPRFLGEVKMFLGPHGSQPKRFDADGNWHGCSECDF